MGVKGVQFMIDNAEQSGLKYYFTAPSCVPATDLESAGAVIGTAETRDLLKLNKIVALGEMMNYPGVIAGQPEVMKKIDLAKQAGLPVDGHAPGLTGQELMTYARAGITTDHECISIAEAEEKIGLGMKIIIREGSAARNFDELSPLIKRFPGMVMLCTDDCHPDELGKGHIDNLLRRGLYKGIDIFSLMTAASIAPVNHYNLDVGLLRPGDPADFITVDNFDELRVTGTWINGRIIFDGEKVFLNGTLPEPVNNFGAKPVESAEIQLVETAGRYRVIRARENRLITGCEIEYMPDVNGVVQPDPERDILKIVVVNRYHPAPPSVGWVAGFNLKYGAMASSIAHDSHNLIAVGTSDDFILSALNAVIEKKGGIAFAGPVKIHVLPLEVAGLMSSCSLAAVSDDYEVLNQSVKQAGCTLESPFMTLSFLSLLVIPHLKMGDRGLFDCDRFEFIPVKVD
jgi:adenine deaminase